MENTNMPKADGKSLDLIQENLEQLKQIFPEVIKEGRVDFEALNDLLGNYGDTAEERFCLNWAGKANARREAQKRSTGTLRPCPEESMDWDSTENLYIEGDNLEVLKLLQKSYHSRVKMIYIDPPYNTGKDFVYKDNYKDNMANYLELTGQDQKLSTNTESDGRYHSNWLNMMYPRLKLARNLLTEDGVIFISIDDNEVANLRKICDEIFGEENFIGTLSVENNPKGRKNSDFVSVSAEYLHIYARSKSNTYFIENIPKNAKDMTEDENGIFVHNSGKRVLVGENGFNNPVLNEESDKNYSVYYRNKDKSIHFRKEKLGQKDQSLLDNGYQRYSSFYKEQLIENTYTATKFKTLFKEEALEFTENKIFEKNFNDKIRIKSQLVNRKYEAIVNGQKQNYSLELTTTGAGTYLKNLFETNDTYFEAPKNKGLLKILLSLFDDKNMVILDFFSGSGTTADAVIHLNAEDGGNRKYICVQIPEPTPEDSEARKAGYATIPEIAKERIRRAGKKIVEEQKKKSKEGGLFAEEPAKLDIGFKVFKLDSSNINAWDSNPDNLETALNNSLFNIKTDRSEDDLLYEILIKYGIELTETINRHTIDGKTVYEMGAGSLIVCLADNLSSAVAEGIGKLYEEVRPEGLEGNCRVVFKDSGFNGSDEVKTNTMLILKQHGILNVASV